jgi:DNA-binding CsgD family transcriptional regulator
MADSRIDGLHEDLTDAVYRAVLNPDGWGDVMALMRTRFLSSAQTFYFLDRRQRKVRPVCLDGIEPGWIRSFDSLYFTPDNPWMQLSERLHRPGVVRTNERLDECMREHGALYRSVYYNDWMRPQRFRHTMGNTLLAEDETLANITLLRSPDMGAFDAADVRDFERLSRHMTRALQMALRLERLESTSAGAVAFDALPRPVALVDAQRRLLHANPAMESLLRLRHGLAVRDGVLWAIDPAAHQQLAAGIADAATDPVADRALSRAVLCLPCAPQAHLTLRVLPVSGGVGRYLPRWRAVLLMADETSSAPPELGDTLRQVHGCTRSEARLAVLIAVGATLRTAAALMGISYGSARVYLKTVFQKVGVHSQAQLVGRLLRLRNPTPPAH